MLHVGYQNYVNETEIVAITGTKSSPLRRLSQRVEEDNRLIDCTTGHKSASFIHLRSGQIVVSALTPVSLINRLIKGGNIDG